MSWNCYFSVSHISSISSNFSPYTNIDHSSIVPSKHTPHFVFLYSEYELFQISQLIEIIFRGISASYNKTVSWYLGYQTFLLENPDIGSRRSAFGQSTGNNISGHYLHHYYFVSCFFTRFFSSIVHFSHRMSDQIQTYLARVDGRAQNTWVRPILRPCRPFWGPWWPFWIVEVLIAWMIDKEKLI